MRKSYGVPVRHLAGWCPFQPRRKHLTLILAILLPFVAFFTIGRPIAGIICLVLQITLIGWLPAAIWAVYALSQYKTDRTIEKALSARRGT